MRKTDAYCKTCFLPATVHKFRATLGKYRILKPNDKVLILYQSGHAGTALLHFIKSGLDLATHKRLRIEPVVLFIDENQHVSIEERAKQYEKFAREILGYGFPGFVTSLHSYMSNFNCPPNYIELSRDVDVGKVRELFGEFSRKTTNLTQYEDMVNTSR